MLKRYSIVLILCLTLNWSCSRINSPDRSQLPVLPFSGELQGALEKLGREHLVKLPIGISVAIGVPGYQTWTGVIGQSYPGVPLDRDMVFDAGSVVKMFEAALALRLAEQGFLDLDAPISHWIPELTNLNRDITVRQLLNHTSGTFNVFEHPEFPWTSTRVDYSREWSLEEAFDNFVSEPYGSPGEVQHYSSTNYLLLTTILEDVAGRDVCQQLSEEFLHPYRMQQSLFSSGEPVQAELHQAHPMVDLNGDGEMEDLIGEAITWKVTLTHPVLYSTPEDLARWMNALFIEQTVLGKNAMEQMMALPEDVTPDPEGASYGLGVVDYTSLLGVPAIGHAGSALGYSTAALYLPEKEVVIVWMVNMGESPAEQSHALMREIWDALYAVLEANCPGTNPCHMSDHFSMQ